MKQRAVLVAALAALLLVVTMPTRADTPTLSGRWSASAMRVAWNMGDWGEACGPKPSGGGAPAGTVTIVQQGSELRFSGAGRSYSTAECWEQFPGLRRTGHSGGQRGWRTSCASAAGDPRQATIVTTLSASDAYITFDETGQYQFVISGQNCTASVRRSRSYKLIQREGEPPPTPTATQSAVPVETPPSKPDPKPSEPPAPPLRTCANPGPPARFEVRPDRKLMRPGDEFSFQTRIQDASGCAIGQAAVWKVQAGDERVKLGAGGKVSVLESASEGDVKLSASVAGKSVTVTVEVASQARYDALLRLRGLNERGESDAAAVAIIASGSIGAGSVTPDERAQERKRRFVGVVGAAALLLGILGLVMVVRSRRQRRIEEAKQGEPEVQVAPTPQVEGAMVCPTCREEYPPLSQFCPVDGNRLVRADENPESRAPAGGMCPVCGQGFDPGVSSCPDHDEELVPAAIYLAQQPADVGRKICPICGTQYPGDGRFCGTDGAALVPVN